LSLSENAPPPAPPAEFAFAQGSTTDTVACGAAAPPAAVPAAPLRRRFRRVETVSVSAATVRAQRHMFARMRP
jgi:hypothetical protein